MAGVILLSAMLVCGVWLYVKRRRERIQDAMIAEAEKSAMAQDNNDNYKNEQSDSSYNKHNADIHDDVEKHPYHNKKNG